MNNFKIFSKSIKSIIPNRNLIHKVNVSTFSQQNSTLIGYVTDLEGNLEFWNNYIDISNVLYRDEANKIKLYENCHFVFGGDVCDRGTGDLRILNDLINLKDTYPDRVHLILGNRDINKLRIPFSISKKVLLKKPRVYWIRNEIDDFVLNNKCYKLKWILKNTMGSPFAFNFRKMELSSTLQREVDDNEVVESFEKSLDSDGVILKYLERGKIIVTIGDILFVHGAIHDFNMGWIPPRLGREARITNSLKEWVDELNEFANEEISDFKKNKDLFLTNDPIDIWEGSGGYDHPQPGSRLLQYGMGWLADKSRNPSVIYSSYLKNGKPDPIEVDTANWLKENKINKVIVGHQPHGDAPFIMDLNDIQVISADSSYSKNTLWPLDYLDHCNDPNFQKNDSNRWISVDQYIEGVKKSTASSSSTCTDEMSLTTRSKSSISEVCFLVPINSISQDQDQSQHLQLSKVFIHGSLSDNSIFLFELEDSQNNEFIGKETKDGWFVKAYGVIAEDTDPSNTNYIDTERTKFLLNYHINANNTMSPHYYLLSYSEGYEFKNKLVHESLIKNYFQDS